MVTGDTIHVYIQVYQTLLIFFNANKQYSICHHFSYVAQRASVVSCYIMNGVNMYAEARDLIHSPIPGAFRNAWHTVPHYFFASNQFNYIDDDNTLETVCASGGFCFDII